MRARLAILLSILCLSEARAQPATDSLRDEAKALAPLVETEGARRFLSATGSLPTPATRTLYRSADRSEAFTESEAAALPEDRRAGLEAREYDDRFYYYTGYGSPLVYARAIDLAAGVWGAESPSVFEGRRVLDFGYGTVGHLRLLASLGAECVGTEVQPLFRALYAGPGDQGPIDGVEGGPGGSVRLLHGRWPGDLAGQAGSGFDLVLSKNVLKRGYIHPARETDPRFLVDLGVDDETFVRAVHDALAPGGLFLIYNISPAQNPPDERYLPHADGRCPFDRALLERAGFEIIEFDRMDTDAMLAYWSALGYDEGRSEREMRTELFAWYTLARRPSAGEPSPAGRAGDHP